MQRLGPVSGTRAPNSGYGYPGGIRHNERITETSLFIQQNQQEFPERARERATRGYLGMSVQQDGYWSKDLEYRLGAVFKGTSR